MHLGWVKDLTFEKYDSDIDLDLEVHKC